MKPLEKILELLRENKKIVIFFIAIISLYTLHSWYLVAQNISLKSENLELSQPSEVEIITSELRELRADWQYKLETVDALRKQANEIEQNRLSLEPIIREKQNELDLLILKK